MAIRKLFWSHKIERLQKHVLHRPSYGTDVSRTDESDLPNYAFPERGVRFYGAIYNKHRDGKQEHKPVELSRSAGSARRVQDPP